MSPIDRDIPRSISSLDAVRRLVETSPVEIEAVFFDVDGTLFDSTGIAARCHAEAARASGVGDVSPEEVARHIGVRRIEAPEEVREMYRPYRELTDREAQELIGLYRRRFRAAVEGEAPGKGKFADVDPLLTFLRNRNISVGIITNRSRDLVVPQLERGRIRYDALKTSTEGNKSEQLRLHMETFKIRDPAQCLVVGDRESDVQAGQAVGMQGVQIIREEGP